MKTKATTSAKQIYLWPFLLFYKPHNTLRKVNDLTLSKIPWYRRWNQDKHSTLVHRLTLLTFLTTVIAITYTFFAFTPSLPVKAEAGSFTQTASQILDTAESKANLNLNDAQDKIELSKASATWTQIIPHGDPNSPTPRGYFGFTYDTANNKTYLFGGNDNSNLNDTWEYNGTNWTKLIDNDQPNTPSRRHGTSMVYIPAPTDRIILFGGYDGSARNDTWAFNPNDNTWTQLLDGSSNSPDVGLWNHRMVYDSSRNKIVLFGGTLEGSYYNGTWEYDISQNTWTQIIPHGNPNSPTPRGYFGFTYDSSNNKTYLFGGNDGSNLNDTWEYDPSNPSGPTWTKLIDNDQPNTPSRRHGTSMVYIPAPTDKIILFGGNDGSARNDTWAFNPNDNTWTQLLDGSSNSPDVGLWHHRMVYDLSRQKVVLFGGVASWGYYYNGTWELTFFDTPQYAPQATLISQTITNQGLFSWGTLTYTPSTSSGQAPNTSLTIDVLNAADNSELAHDVSSVIDLNSIENPPGVYPLQGIPSIKLRANFSTTDPSNSTPTLSDWTVNYQFDVTPPSSANPNLALTQYPPETQTPNPYTSLKLTWNPYTDNESEIGGYRIFRSSDNTNFSQIADISLANPPQGFDPDHPSYTDTNLTVNTTYYYKIKAYDKQNNESVFSNTAFSQPAPYTAHTGENGYFVKGDTGSDSYPGTSSQPFKTIAKAAEVVLPGDIVNIQKITPEHPNGFSLDDNSFVNDVATLSISNPNHFMVFDDLTITASGTGSLEGSWDNSNWFPIATDVSDPSGQSFKISDSTGQNRGWHWTGSQGSSDTFYLKKSGLIVNSLNVPYKEGYYEPNTRANISGTPNAYITWQSPDNISLEVGCAQEVPIYLNRAFQNPTYNQFKNIWVMGGTEGNILDFDHSFIEAENYFDAFSKIATRSYFIVRSISEAAYIYNNVYGSSEITYNFFVASFFEPLGYTGTYNIHNNTFYYDHRIYDRGQQGYDSAFADWDICNNAADATVFDNLMINAQDGYESPVFTSYGCPLPSTFNVYNNDFVDLDNVGSYNFPDYNIPYTNFQANPLFTNPNPDLSDPGSWNFHPLNPGVAIGAFSLSPSAPISAVSNVAPLTGSNKGTTDVTITGTNLIPQSTVKFGSYYATHVEACSGNIDNTCIKATTPELPSGILPITVNSVLTSFSFTVTADTFYVSTTGDDNNDGKTQETAFRTIQKAADTARAGDTVNILPGDYDGATFSHSGAADFPITFQKIPQTNPPDPNLEGDVNIHSSFEPGVGSLEYLTFQNLHFHRYFEFGHYMHQGNGANHFKILNNYFSGGLSVIGDYVLFSGNTFESRFDFSGWRDGGIEFSNNYVLESDLYIWDANNNNGTKNTKVINNIFVQRDEYNYISLDEGFSNLEIKNNTFIAFSGPILIKSRNWSDFPGLQIENNIFALADQDISLLDACSSPYRVDACYFAQGVSVKNNNFSYLDNSSWDISTLFENGAGHPDYSTNKTLNPYFINPTSDPNTWNFSVQNPNLSGIGSTLFPFLPHYATTYYVSNSGSDTNDGLSQNTAFKTIQKAANTAQFGDTVDINPGIYQESLSFPNSGVAGSPITFQKTPGSSGDVEIRSIEWSESKPRGPFWSDPINIGYYGKPASSHLTFDGLKILGSIQTGSNISNITIKNFTILYGYLWFEDTQTLIFDRNIFYGAEGLYLADGTDYVQITNNLIIGNVSYDGLIFFAYTTTPNINISNNTIIARRSLFWNFWGTNLPFKGTIENNLLVLSSPNNWFFGGYISAQASARNNDFYILDGTPVNLADPNLSIFEPGTEQARAQENTILNPYFVNPTNDPATWNYSVQNSNLSGIGTTLFPYRPDSTPPASFTPTANPSGWTNQNPVIRFSTTDSGSGIDRYELKIDSGSFSRQTSPYTLPSLSDGEHTITVKAFDKVGNSRIGSVKVYIDTTPPSTTNSPFSSDWTKDNVSITLSASDSSSGVKQTFYSLDGSTPSLLYTSPITLSSSGTYTLRYFSTDNAGNTESVKDAGQAKIDKDPPSVPQNLSATPLSQTQIALTWGASADNHSGLKDYQLYRSTDDISFTLISTQTTTSYSDTDLTSNTTYYYKVLSRDNLDNLSSFSSVSSAVTADYPIPNSPLISGGDIIFNLDQNTLTISGVTIPDADVTLEISSDPYLFTFLSDSKGYFTFALNLNDYPLSPGTHSLRAKVRNKVTGKESAFSSSISFDIPASPAGGPAPPVTPTPIVNQVVDTIKKATQSVTNALNTFSNTLKSIIPEAITSVTTSAPVQATITASTIAVAAIPSVIAPALSGAASASPSIIAHIFFPLIDGINHLFAYLYYAFTSLMYFLGIWKKPKKWGTVYDSITKKPIALSFVKLFGRHVETRVTDKDGRFGFYAPKGTYNIIVSKPGFNFPSGRVTLEDYPYSDIYYGKVFVLEKEQKIHYDIPVDPMTEEKRIFSLNRSLNSVRVNLTQPALIFSALGLVYSLIVFFLELKLLNFAILLVITTIFTLNIRNFLKSKGIKLKIR